MLSFPSDCSHKRPYAPTGSVFAAEISCLIRVTQQITLTQTPTITVEHSSVHSANVNGTLRIEGITPNDVQIFVYELDEEGFLVTDNALALFADAVDIVVTQEGELVLAQDATLTSLVTDGVFEAGVSVTGKYYLKLVSGNKYVYVPVLVN